MSYFKYKYSENQPISLKNWFDENLPLVKDLSYAQFLNFQGDTSFSNFYRILSNYEQFDRTKYANSNAQKAFRELLTICCLSNPFFETFTNSPGSNSKFFSKLFISRLTVSEEKA